ncbi:MAG TPA: hypothetical protein VF274_10200 [Alphaproteobacteria bacterium]
MSTKSAVTGEMDAACSTRLVAVRDRRTGRVRLPPAAHVLTGRAIERAGAALDMAFLAALGRGGRG